MGKFFAVEPQGAGSGLVESLTSYIARLALEHHISPRAFVLRQIVPQLKPRALADARGHCDLFSHMGSALNGINETARQVVAVLEKGTERCDIRSLTLGSLGGIFATRATVRQRAAWCPRCFLDWRLKGKRLYVPLLWQMVLVRVCPLHSVPLVQLCPKCGKAAFPLQRYSHPGFCPFCRAWLGTDVLSASGCGCLGSREPFSEGMLDLIAAHATNSLPSNLAIFRKNLHNANLVAFGGSLNSFAKFAGLHHSSLMDLLMERSKPSPETAIRLSLSCDVQPASMLRDLIQVSEFRHSQRHFFSPKPCKKYDWIQVQQSIDSELAKPAQNRTSLHGVCRSQKIDSGYVGRRLPGCARTLIRDYRVHVSRRHRRREATERQHLCNTFRNLCRNGIWPSHRRMREALGTAASLRDPELRKIRKKLLRQCASALPAV